MTKILLVCCAGMSTSLLVTRMEEEAAKRNLDCKIWATSEGQLENEYKLDAPDIILVGPQIRYLVNQIKKTVNHSIPVELIDMRTYGLMDGGKVLDQALNQLK